MMAETQASPAETESGSGTQDTATATASRHPVEGWLGLLLALVGGVLASATLYPSYVGYLLSGSWFSVPNLGLLGWVAFAPVLVAVGAAVRARHAFARGFVFAVPFFLLTCAFIIQVHWVGWLVSGLCFGVMVGAFAVLVRLLALLGPVWAVFAWPSAWVVGDWLVGNVGIKFPWLYAAYSQLDVNPWVVQSADLFGVWGTSWLILAVNALIAVVLLTRWQLLPSQRLRKQRQPWRAVLLGKPLRVPALVMLALLVAAHVYGAVRLTTLTEERGPVVALVQNNVPIGLHRDKPDGKQIVDRLLEQLDAIHNPATFEPGTYRLPAKALRSWRDQYEYVRDEMIITRTVESNAGDEVDEVAAAFPPVDLVVFPENFPLRQRIYELTEIPGRGYSQHDLYFRSLIEKLAEMDAYWLLNSIELTQSVRPRVEYEREEPYPHFDLWRQLYGAANTSMLIAPGGEVLERYLKIELVPVGEYVPLRDYTSITRQLTETIIGSDAPDYEFGTEHVVFEMPVRAGGGGETVRFATPICFESNFPNLLRNFVRQGAEALIIQSDDGWFVPSNEPEQVWLGARFRAIENRVSVARAVSSGHTGVVGPDGAYRARLIGEYNSETMTWGFPGVLITELPRGPGWSIYQQVGDIFVLAALLPVLTGVILLVVRRRSRSKDAAGKSDSTLG